MAQLRQKPFITILANIRIVRIGAIQMNEWMNNWLTDLLGEWMNEWINQSINRSINQSIGWLDILDGGRDGDRRNRRQKKKKKKKKEEEEEKKKKKTFWYADKDKLHFYCSFRTTYRLINNNYIKSVTYYSRITYQLAVLIQNRLSCFGVVQARTRNDIYIHMTCIRFWKYQTH